MRDVILTAHVGVQWELPGSVGAQWELPGACGA
jgi:hypothetical protein